MIRRPSAQRLGEARRRRALYSGLDGAGGPAGGWLLGFPSLPWVVCFLSFFSPPFLCASPFMVRTGTYTGTPTKGIPFFIFLSASPTPQLHNPHTFAFSDGPPLRGSEAAMLREVVLSDTAPGSDAVSPGPSLRSTLAGVEGGSPESPRAARGKMASRWESSFVLLALSQVRG